MKGLFIVPKIKDEKTFKRISVALNEEVYNGVKSLAAVSGASITDYVANILAGQVKENELIIQQIQTARRAYEASISKVAEKEKTAE